MKKRVLFITISILVLLAVILTINSAPKEKIYLNKDNIEANKSLAIYIEQENGSYNKTATFPGKEDGYTLNTSKSVCNGSTNISWDEESWGIELSNIDREETKCYLYFDIYVPTASDIILDKIKVNEGTPDFSKVATTDEGVFKTEDGMYGGTSYYWRGATTTNHMIFANKCWRIIRINGDGSIRLIYNGDIQEGNTCTGNGDNSESIAVASQKYNAGYDNSSYVGYTYTVSFQRPTPTTGGTESNLKTQTDTWYNNNIGNNEEYASHVVDGKYCNDRNMAAGYTWSATGSSFNYAAAGRLESAKTPNLSCDEQDVYTLKAGAITADEVSMAGGVNGSTNSSYYLYNGLAYWTMSPFGWSGNPGAFFVLANGNFDWCLVQGGPAGVRPVINLRSDVTFNSGSDGSENKPFVVS